MGVYISSNWGFWLEEICKIFNWLETLGHQQPSWGLQNTSLADTEKHKSIVHQLDFIGSLLQAKVNNRVLVKLESRYTDYFPEYSNHFGRALILLNSMYGMTNSRKLFSD